MPLSFTHYATAFAAIVLLSMTYAVPAGAQDDVKVNGKTAAQWEAEADRDLAAAKAMNKTAAPHAVAAPHAAPHSLAQPLARAAIGQPAAAIASNGGIDNGAYTCIAGFRIMLTLGTMTINGNHYRFHPPAGRDTSGTYGFSGGRLHWSSDIGIISNGKIVDSNFDPGRTDDFWFSYDSGDGPRSPTSANCKK